MPGYTPALFMQTWIFQANPKIYDIAGAIRSLKVDTWLVKRHGPDIRQGDRVYLWESGRDGGIVAIAEVLDEGADRAMAKESERFVLDPLKLGGVQPRVRILIVKVVDPKLKRSAIKEQPELADLSIL